MLFSVLKLFISIWVENCYTFKGQSFENGLFYIFQAIGSIFVAKAIEYKGSVQLLSCVQLFVAPWTAACQASLSITNSWSLLKFMSIELVMPSNHLSLCHPLLLLPSVLPNIRVFFSESYLCIRWPKCWSFSFSISPSNEYSGLISFRMDWFDFLAVQGALKSLLQHHHSKAISSLVLSLLYDPNLTSLLDYRKNHIFDYMDLCWQSDASAFFFFLMKAC